MEWKQLVRRTVRSRRRPVTWTSLNNCLFAQIGRNKEREVLHPTPSFLKVNGARTEGKLTPNRRGPLAHRKPVLFDSPGCRLPRVVPLNLTSVVTPPLVVPKLRPQLKVTDSHPRSKSPRRVKVIAGIYSKKTSYSPTPPTTTLSPLHKTPYTTLEL